MSGFSPPPPPPLGEVYAQARRAQPNPHKEDDMSGFWDDPDVKVASDWFKFEKKGDVISGVIARLGKRVWQDASVGIEIMFEDEDTPSVTASQVLLKQALFALKPETGDWLSIELGAIEKRPGGKTLKRFIVQIKRADGSTDTVDQTS